MGHKWSNDTRTGADNVDGMVVGQAHRLLQSEWVHFLLQLPEGVLARRVEKIVGECGLDDFTERAVQLLELVKHERHFKAPFPGFGT